MRVGPAGWSYADWDGRVYPQHKPPAFHPLAFLARYFDCIEINASFYATPRAEHAERWVQLVAEHPRFRFFAKLQREFTHAGEPAADTLGEWERIAAEFRDGIAPLARARRLSGLLVQFPVTFLHGRNEVRRLGRLRALFDPLPLVLEVRHQSWFEPPALDRVRGLGYSLAYVDLPPAWNHPPLWHEPTGPIGYLRLHGRNAAHWFRSGSGRDEKYDYLYTPRELDELAEKARRMERAHDDSSVITNNHFGGQAVANALELLHRLSGELVPAPAGLVAAFPRLGSQVRPEGQGRLF